MAEEMCPLTSAPLEIVEYLLQNLELEDIKNVRLTCKYLATIGPRFKSFVAQQTTDLSVESLNSQRELASHRELGSAVTTLVIMASVFDTSELDELLKTKRKRSVEHTGVFTKSSERKCSDEELAKATSDLDWMHAQQAHQRSQAFAESVDSLAVVLRFYGTLDTIEVDACVTKGPNERVSTAKAGEWHPVFVRASEVYRITTSAIAKSEILLKTLLMYRVTPRCSVPSFDVTSHMAELEALPGFIPTFSSLENFALSFSTRVQTDFSIIEAAREELEGADEAYHNAMGSRTGQYSHNSPESMAEENFPGIARMLCQMPKLDAFDLHMINAAKGPTTVYQKILEHIANEVNLPVLTQVFIRGLPTSEESLFKFLKNHPTISELHLEEMRLSSGSWKHAIPKIAQLPALSSLHFYNLYDDNGLFNLLSKGTDEEEREKYCTWSNSYRCLRGIKVHTRSFDREEIRQLQTGLTFDDTDIGRQLGSAQFMNWMNKRRFRYQL